MMEQLAERRMQREEEAAADVEDDSDEEDDEEGDDDDDDDDEEEEDDDDDDEEVSILCIECFFFNLAQVMTEEQKMEEGKRMFSIFAARMFEQRVLQAFREKVAQERQMQLLRELEDEDKLTKEREAKKQTQNQKKKAKKMCVSALIYCFVLKTKRLFTDFKNKPAMKSELPKRLRRLQRRPLQKLSRQLKRMRSERNAKKNVLVAKLPGKLQMKRNSVKRRSVVNALQRKRSGRLSGSVNARKGKIGLGRSAVSGKKRSARPRRRGMPRRLPRRLPETLPERSNKRRRNARESLPKKRRRRRKRKRNGLPSSNELASTPVHQPLPVLQSLRNALRATTAHLRKFSASPSPSLPPRPEVRHGSRCSRHHSSRSVPCCLTLNPQLLWHPLCKTIFLRPPLLIILSLLG
jgi:hypothetical protein